MLDIVTKVALIPLQGWEESVLKLIPQEMSFMFFFLYLTEFPSFGISDTCVTLLVYDDI